MTHLIRVKKPGGEPRQLENPYIRTEDISAVIDYLTPWMPTIPESVRWEFVPVQDTANAAIQDRRIKAIGTVSAVNNRVRCSVMVGKTM